MLWLLGIIALIAYIVLHSQPECTHIYGFVLIVEDTFTFFFLGGGGFSSPLSSTTARPQETQEPNISRAHAV